MDLEIKGLSLTLVLGLAFTAALIECLRLTAFIGPDRVLFRGVLALETQRDAIVRSVALLAIFIGIGILFEDLSKNSLAVRDPRWAPYPFEWLMPTERSERARPLIKLTDGGELRQRCDQYFEGNGTENRKFKGELTHLGKRMLALANQASSPFASVDPASLATFQKLMTPGSLISCDELESVNEIYYRAKNRVFLEENYFKELSAIRARGDFARSAVYIAILSGWMLAVAMVIRLAAIKIPTLRFADAALAPPLSMPWFRAGVFAVVIMAIAAAGLVTYVSEEGNFCNRVFGYFEVVMSA